MILRKSHHLRPFLLSISIVTATSMLCFLFVDFIGYRTVALILLLAVSVNAILFEILPVIISAFLSAMIWNFFYIPPIFTFHISTAEDGLMFLMYFVIASINAVLTTKIREIERKRRLDEEKIKTIELYNTLLNSLSHELRTPVSTIIGAVDTLKESKSHLSEVIQFELLSQVDMASHRLNRQVENLLNMSRLESGTLKLNLDWCDLNELLFSIVQKLSEHHRTHHIVFNANENSALIKLDSGLMEQVFHNLIYNALLYTPDHSIIQIEVSHQTDRGVITIEDNGKGIPEDLKKSVFEKFYRLPKSKAGGSGLGLSIAKGFIEAHHGTIELTTNENGGATFTIILPAEISFINQLHHG